MLGCVSISPTVIPYFLYKLQHLHFLLFFLLFFLLCPLTFSTHHASDSTRCLQSFNSANFISTLHLLYSTLSLSFPISFSLSFSLSVCLSLSVSLSHGFSPSERCNSVLVTSVFPPLVSESSVTVSYSKVCLYFFHPSSHFHRRVSRLISSFPFCLSLIQHCLHPSLTLQPLLHILSPLLFSSLSVGLREWPLFFHHFSPVLPSDLFLWSLMLFFILFLCSEISGALRRVIGVGLISGFCDFIRVKKEAKERKWCYIRSLVPSRSCTYCNSLVFIRCPSRFMSGYCPFFSFSLFPSDYPSCQCPVPCLGIPSWYMVEHFWKYR